MRITLTVLSLVFLCSCSEATAESNTTSQEIVEKETTNTNQEVQEQPIVLENENYPEDWNKMKAALISKVKDDIGIWCAMAGVNKDKLVGALDKSYVMEMLKVTELSDLVPDQKGDITYLKFYAENPVDASKNLSIFIKQGGHLILEYFIEME